MYNDRIRVIDLETGGNGAYDVCEIGWQDVVLDERGQWELNEERGALFVDPGRPITPDTMSIHHILDNEVAGAPYWRDVAPLVLKPQGGVVALAAHRAAFEQRYCTPRLSNGFVPGNVPFGFGPTSTGFPTRCCVASVCHEGLFTS